MSSSTTVEPPSPSGPSPSPSSPTFRPSADYNPPFHTSTPNFVAKKTQPSLSVVLPATVPSTPTTTYGEPTPTLTPPPRSPGGSTVPSGDARGGHPVDGTSSDKSSETAVAGVARSPNTALSRKESYKAQRQHYRREKKRAATALLHSIEDPSVVLLADWLKVRGSLKSWTKLWCVLKPGLLLLYKSSKAKSNHWVGTVLLTSCQVIERPSKKDGFCFKLYHPLEQSIWAPRGPHNETIGAVVQPLPTAHLIFRAPSPAAGHCWLDGLELALKCTNAMLRCSRSRPETQNTNEDVPDAHISHEELEKHFNEHVCKLSQVVTCRTPSSLQSLSERPKRKLTSWAQFMESIEKMNKDNSSASQSPDYEEKKTSRFFDFTKRRQEIQIRTPILKLPLPRERKSKLSSPSLEESIFKLVTGFPRRSSTPSSLTTKRVRELRASGVKTDSENDGSIFKNDPEVICETPDNIRILKTAPSVDRYLNYSEDVGIKSSSSTDECHRPCRSETPTLKSAEKYSLIDCKHLPSVSYAALKAKTRDERISTQNVYMAGKIVASELAGAASDTDSDEPRVAVVMSEGARPEDLLQQRNHIISKIENTYTEDLDLEIGAAGELVEEVAEENKSLIWFLMKQVRPGMDLSKVVLPTFILEPRSFLDKLSDSYYHADILGLASQLDDPYLRFKTILRWYLSGLYKKPKGLKKPYNPVLGETFRCYWKHPNSDTYTFYLAEQVSHHPPISAFYVSNRKEGFVIEGSLLARSKFFGNSTSAILEGCAKIVLLKWNESYITTAPYAHCKGIVIGTLSMELGGKVSIVCNETGYSADIEFKLRSFLGSSESTNAISGRIKKGKETIATVDGYWDGRIDIRKKNSEETNLLDVGQLKDLRLRRYLVKLDEQHEFESQKLWIKVSEAITNDDQVTATEQKTIIEEAQRVRARSQNDPWIPKFFHKINRVDPPEGIIDQGWRYNYENLTPWKPNDELFEYEDDYVIKSLMTSPVASVSVRSSEPRRAVVGTDSESQVDVTRRSKTSSRTLKMLQSIDSTLQDQTLAIERLSKTIDLMTEGSREVHPQRPRALTTNTPWDLFAGFVLAIVLQALLNWLFYNKV